MQVESDLKRLQVDNQKLKDELRQALSDKEFVWSLWKRLQVASPDITQAISLVLQREKEKSEANEAKALQILRAKDDQIDDLQRKVTKQSKELSSLIQQKSDLLDNVQRLEADVVNLRDRAQQLESESKSDGMEENYRRVIDNYERENHYLNERISLLETEHSKLKGDGADLIAAKVVCDNRLQLLEVELERCLDSKEKARCCAEDLEGEVTQLRAEVVRLEERADRSSEDADLQSELEEWRQRCEEQEDTIRKMKNASAYKAVSKLENECRSLQARLSHYERLYGRLRDKPLSNSQVRGKMGGKRARSERPTMEPGYGDSDEDTLSACSDLTEETGFEGSELEDENRVTSPVVDLNYKVKRLEGQVNLLRDCLRKKNTALGFLKPPHLRTHAAPLGAARKCLALEATRRKLAFVTKKSERFESLLKEKTEELRVVQDDLDKTSTRLRAVQANNRITKQQLRHLEMDNQTLQKELDAKSEDCDFTSEHVSFMKKRNHQLDEELQILKVQAGQDTDRIRELLMALEHARKKFDDAVEEGEAHAATYLKNLKVELDRKTAKNMKLKRELKTLKLEVAQHSAFHSAWDSEKKALKVSLESLAEEMGQKRVELTSLNRTINQLNRGVTTLSRDPGQVHTSEVTSLLDRILPDRHGRQGLDDASVQTTDRSSSNNDGGLSGSKPDTGRTDSSLGTRIVSVANGSVEDKQPRATAGGTLVKPCTMKVPSGDRSLKDEDLDKVPTRDVSNENSPRDSEPPETGLGEALGGTALAAAVMRLPENIILKRRIAALQQQLRAVRRSKSQTASSLANMQTKNRQVSQELTQSRERANRMRENMERLSDELAGMRADKETLLLRLRADPSAEGTSAVIDSLTTETGPGLLSTTQDGRVVTPVRGLDGRAREQTGEVLRQAAIIRNLRTELDVKEEKMKELRDKVLRLERDSTSKKQLVDDLRQKLKATQDVTQADKEALVSHEERIQGLQDVIDRQKVQLESLKTRIATVSEERRRYEADFCRERDEACALRGQLTEAKSRRVDAERARSEAEKAAEERVAEIVRRTGGAVDTAREQVAGFQARINQCERVINLIAHLMVSKLEEMRALADAGNQRRTPGLYHSGMGGAGDLSARCKASARDRAASILALSPVDMDQLLSPRSVSRVREESRTDDQEWIKLVQNRLAKSDFVTDLQRAFTEKLTEIANLMRRVM